MREEKRGPKKFTDPRAIAEIEAHCAKHGQITPRRLAKLAANPRLALHQHFTWDDSEAGEKYRVIQAARILRTIVLVIPGDPRPVRAFVSLVEDRGNVGFRRTIDVMTDVEMRGRLLDQALRELEGFRARYSHLKELAVVFAAVDSVERKKGARRAR